MPRPRSEFTVVMFDENFKQVPKDLRTKVQGDYYIRDLIHADKSEIQKEQKNTKRPTLPYDGDPEKSPIPLKHFTRSKKSWKTCARLVWEPEFLNDIKTL